MTINSIRERIDTLEGKSTFYLVDYERTNTTESVNEVTELEDGPKYDQIVIDGTNRCLLTDKEGNILRDFRDAGKTTYYVMSKDGKGKLKEGYNHVKYYKIYYVNENNIIISEEDYHPKKNGKKTPTTEIFTRYRLENGHIKALQDLVRGRDFTNIEVKFVDSDTLLIELTNKDKKEAFLYSLSKNEELTPRFTNLEETDNKGLFKFTDRIESKETIDGEKEETNIIGFITRDGIFLNQIYDETINDTRDVDLNSHPNFLQYGSLKRMISLHLDSIVDEKINKQHAKNQAIKSMQIKAANNQQ